jgi:hypothetical protein
MAKRPGNHPRFAAFVAALLLALALTAVPTAVGAKPVRTVVPFTEPIFLPAGLGCAFPVRGQPGEGSRAMITEFSDGRVQTIDWAQANLTNLDTGETILWRSRFLIRETIDPATNELVSVVSGRHFVLLFPGDQGPSGEVGEPGALLGIVGRERITVDLDTGVVTSYSLNGQATDLCALLS